jgi:purine nucleosidase
MDPGVDDALAIMLALRSPELKVLGISTVSGNVPVEKGTRNTLRILSFLGRHDIPVYGGAGRPLVREAIYATDVHGPEGMGEALLPDPGTLPAGDGIEFLVEAISAHPDEITLIATGPLTNLALAEERSPGILGRLNRLIVMGGAIEEPGNITPVAEFNFYVDPHAARRVVQSGAPLTLVTLDATHRVELGMETIRQRIIPLKTPTSQFIAAALRTWISFGERLYGRAVVHLHDPLAVGVAIDPSLFNFAPVFLDVETEGLLTVGQVVSDRRQFIREKDRLYHRVGYAADVDSRGFIEMFLERVLKGRSLYL